MSDMIIPKLRHLTQTVHHTKWEAALHTTDWGFIYEQASNLAQAMNIDITHELRQPQVT